MLDISRISKRMMVQANANGCLNFFHPLTKRFMAMLALESVHLPRTTHGESDASNSEAGRTSSTMHTARNIRELTMHAPVRPHCLRLRRRSQAANSASAPLGQLLRTARQICFAPHYERRPSAQHSIYTRHDKHEPTDLTGFGLSAGRTNSIRALQ